uniref:Uncharacterized protein n=1 Tax=Cacopsylla melanoneura TaxID=428564 RepID=A0A8D8T710_9HEMI
MSRKQDTKRTLSRVVKNRSNNNKNPTDFEDMNHQELREAMENLSVKHKEDRILAIYDKICEDFSATEKNLVEQIESLNEDNAARDNKIKALMRQNDDLLEDYNDQVDHYLGKLKDNSIEIAQLRKSIEAHQNTEFQTNEVALQLQDQNEGMKITIEALKGTITELKKQGKIYKLYYDSDLENTSSVIEFSNHSIDFESSLLFELNNTINNEPNNQHISQISPQIHETSKDGNRTSSTVTSPEKISNREGADDENENDVTIIEICNISNINDSNEGEESKGNDSEADDSINLLNRIRKLTQQKNIDSNNSTTLQTFPLSTTDDAQQNTQSDVNNMDTNSHKTNNNLKKNKNHQSPQSPTKDKEDRAPYNSTDKGYATQTRLTEIEEVTKTNTSRIQKIEQIINLERKSIENMGKIKSANKDVKKNCYFAGDSHFRDFQMLCEKNQELMKNYSVNIKFAPGKGIEDICKLIPSEMDINTTIIVSAGTNDLYRTNLDTFKNELQKLDKLNKRIILISIPPQNCRYTNQDINNFNTSIKYLCKTTKNIEVLNSHAFIKPNHLLSDGVHLKGYAKEWIISKLTCMLNNDSTKTSNTDNNTNNNQKAVYNSKRVSELPKHNDITVYSKTPCELDTITIRRPNQVNPSLYYLNNESESVLPNAPHMPIANTIVSENQQFNKYNHWQEEIRETARKQLWNSNNGCRYSTNLVNYNYDHTDKRSDGKFNSKRNDYAQHNIWKRRTNRPDIYSTENTELNRNFCQPSFNEETWPPIKKTTKCSTCGTNLENMKKVNFMK